MTITVQSQQRHDVLQRCKALLQAVDQIATESFVSGNQRVRQKIIAQQKLPALYGETINTQRNPVAKRSLRTHPMHTPQKAPHDQQIVRVIQLRWVTCLTGEQRQPEGLIIYRYLMQRTPFEYHRRHNRYI